MITNCFLLMQTMGLLKTMLKQTIHDLDLTQKIWSSISTISQEMLARQKIS